MRIDIPLQRDELHIKRMLPLAAFCTKRNNERKFNVQLRFLAILHNTWLKHTDKFSEQLDGEYCYYRVYTLLNRIIG